MEHHRLSLHFLPHLLLLLLLFLLQQQIIVQFSPMVLHNLKMFIRNDQQQKSVHFKRNLLMKPRHHLLVQCPKEIYRRNQIDHRRIPPCPMTCRRFQLHRSVTVLEPFRNVYSRIFKFKDRSQEERDTRYIPCVHVDLCNVLFPSFASCCHIQTIFQSLIHCTSLRLFFVELVGRCFAFYLLFFKYL